MTLPARAIGSRPATRRTCVACMALCGVFVLNVLTLPLASAATPPTMQAIVQNGVGGVEVLSLQTVPVLEPAAGEVLIRVYAAAVNPADAKIRSGKLFSVKGPRIPGIDVAGVVEKLGPEVKGIKTGDAVWAMLGRPLTESERGLNGGYAEYVLVEASRVMRKPKTMTYAQAAGLGAASVAAVRFSEPLQLSRGQTLLVTGVSGGVGSAMAQVAKARGVHVIGTATLVHADYLLSIGVDEVIDYTVGNFEDHISGADAVFDTRGGDTAERSLKTLKKGGRMVTVVGRVSPEKCMALEVNCLLVPNEGEPGGKLDSEVLVEVNRHGNDGKLKINVDRLYPLDKAGEAQSYSEQGHAEGKIILAVNGKMANKR